MKELKKHMKNLNMSDNDYSEVVFDDFEQLLILMKFIPEDYL